MLALTSQENPYHADVYNNLGVIFAKKGMHEAAMDAYNNAIRVTETKNLDYTDAYYNRANLLYLQENYTQAIADYTVTIEYNTNAKNEEMDFTEVYYNRGLCHYRKPEYGAAISDYEKAISINPSFTWAHYSKAYIHFEKNEYDSAIAGFQLVLTLPNDFKAPEGAHSWAHYGLAIAYEGKGQLSDRDNHLTTSCGLGNQTACHKLTDLGLPLP